jgi:hypothetical protein
VSNGYDAKRLFVQNTHMFSMACEGTFRDRPFRRNTGIQRLQPIYSGNQYCGLDPTDHGSQTAKSGAKSRIAWKAANMRRSVTSMRGTASGRSAVRAKLSMPKRAYQRQSALLPFVG